MNNYPAQIKFKDITKLSRYNVYKNQGIYFGWVEGATCR